MFFILFTLLMAKYFFVFKFFEIQIVSVFLA
jgi:hypothetical protein